MASAEVNVEEAENDPNTDKIDPHLIQYMRVALAVAIIKTKPAGQSAQVYAEQLCLQYREAQLQWKSTAEKLKEEVLLLRQQLLQTKWSDQGLLPKNASRDEDVSADDNQVFPTPPCSSEDAADRLRAPSAQQQVLQQHASFLQSVLTLSTISTHQALDGGEASNSVTIDPVFEQTALESIQSALITLGDLLANPKPQKPAISQKMLFHMVQVLSNLVDNRGFSQYFSGAVCDQVLCFSWGIITALLANTTLPESACDCLSQLIVLLCKSPTLRPPIMKMLVTQLAQVTSHLQTVQLHRIPLNIPLFQKSYHILHSLERIIENDILKQDKCLTLAFCHDLQRQLDVSLLHIWQRFEPFSQYVWHIQSLLQYLHPALSETGPPGAAAV